MKSFRVERTVEGLSEADLPDGIPSAGAVHRYLEERGYAVAGVSVGPLWRERDAGPPDGGDRSLDGYVVTVRADRDPSPDLLAFAPGPSPAEQARVELAAALAGVRAKAETARTPAERAVLALARLLDLG